MDIRSAADFAEGHIENAVNVPAGDVLSHLESVDLSGYDEVSVVCKSGQTAAWATCLLRLMGYDNVYSMKFGMCSWNAEFADAWNNNTKSTYSTQFVSTVTEKGLADDLPELSTGKEAGQEILEAPVDEVH
jgi:rhodanese-related sulfurtransferase